MTHTLKTKSKPFSDIRQHAYAARRAITPNDTRAGLADISNGHVLVILNDRWRVIIDPLQRILEVRTGRPSKKATGWRSRSFCVQRDTLLRCIHEYCGPVDADALKIIEALPARHVDQDEVPVERRPRHRSDNDMRGRSCYTRRLSS